MRMLALFKLIFLPLSLLRVMMMMMSRDDMPLGMCAFYQGVVYMHLLYTCTHVRMYVHVH